MSSFDGVSDLFLTLPPPSRTVKGLRGSVRQDLLRLFFARLRRLATTTSDQLFAAPGTKTSRVQAHIPDGFVFPQFSFQLDLEDWRAMFHHAVRCLRARSPTTEAILAFMKENVPRRSVVENEDEDRALRRLPKPKSRFLAIRDWRTCPKWLETILLAVNFSM